MVAMCHYYPAYTLEMVLALPLPLFRFMATEQARAEIQRLLDALLVHFAKEPDKVRKALLRSLEEISPTPTDPSQADTTLPGGVSLGDLGQLPKGMVQTVAFQEIADRIKANQVQDEELQHIASEEGMGALIQRIHQLRAEHRARKAAKA